MTSRSSRVPEDHAASKRVLFRNAVASAARRADALVAVSQRTADLLDDLVRPRTPVTVIHHGVDHHASALNGGDEAADRCSSSRSGWAATCANPPRRHHRATQDHAGLLRADEILCVQTKPWINPFPRPDLAGGAWSGDVGAPAPACPGDRDSDRRCLVLRVGAAPTTWPGARPVRCGSCNPVLRRGIRAARRRGTRTGGTPWSRVATA